MTSRGVARSIAAVVVLTIAVAFVTFYGLMLVSVVGVKVVEPLLVFLIVHPAGPPLLYALSAAVAIAVVVARRPRSGISSTSNVGSATRSISEDLRPIDPLDERTT